jgi:hypothetical protein
MRCWTFFRMNQKQNIEGIEDAINILYSDIENLNAVKRIEADALSLKSAAKMLGFRKHWNALRKYRTLC